jgi:hypothetical protein
MIERVLGVQDSRGLVNIPKGNLFGSLNPRTLESLNPLL